MSTSEPDVTAVIAGYLARHKEIQRLLVQTRRAEAAGDRPEALELLEGAKEALRQLEAYEASHRPIQIALRRLAD